MTPDTPVSAHFEPFIVRDLQNAAARHDLAAIDQITDLLVQAGQVRRRGDISQLDKLRAQCSRVTRA